MSPTVFRIRSFRFLFFSREESRMHIHVQGPKGEAKFWIEPSIELARSQGLTEAELNWLQQIIEERENEIRAAWRHHFGG